MQEGMTVGLDLAKKVFQVHAIGAEGKIIERGQLRRAEVLKFFIGLSANLAYSVMGRRPLALLLGPGAAAQGSRA